MELRPEHLLKWSLFFIIAHSTNAQNYDDDRNHDAYDPYSNNNNNNNNNRDYNRNHYDPYNNRNNQTGNYDPHNRNQGGNYDPYSRNPSGNNDPYSNRQNQTYDYNRNQDSYNRNQNDPYNRNPNDPYNRNQDQYNRNQNDPYSRNYSSGNPNDPYSRNQDPYNRNPNDPYNRNPNDPYNRNPNNRNDDQYNRSRNPDTYNRNQDPNNPYEQDRTYNRDYNRNNDNRDDRYRNNQSNYGGSNYDGSYSGSSGNRYGPDDGSCCEEYCYSVDERPYVKMGSKTPYQFAYGKISNQHIVPQCKPVQYWSVVREGTSLPDRVSVERYRELRKIKDEIVRNYQERKSYPDRGRLCAEDYSLLRDWRWADNISDHNAGTLTPQGAEDLKFLARRFQSRLRDLLVPYSETQYYFQYTEGDRSHDSYQAFIQGLFGNDAARVHASVRAVATSFFQNTNNDQSNYNPFASQNSYSSGSQYGMQSQYDNSGLESKCKNFEQQRDENRNTASEYQAYKQKEDYKNMVRNVFRRLGFKYSLNDSLIEDMYDLCRYEKSWYVVRPSPWCAAFTKEHMKILEYGDDLYYYYRSGYGHEMLNRNLGCGLLKDMYDRFERTVNGATNEQKGIVLFRNLDTLLKLMVTLGIGRDDSILTADNYHQFDRRQWRTSDLAPFSGNLAAVLYQCDNQDEKFKVMFFLNEKPVEFPECSVGLCSWQTVRNKFESLAQECRLDWCERGAASANFSSQLFIIFSALFALYKSMF